MLITGIPRFAAIAVPAIFCCAAHAQNYPTRPVRWVIPYSAGGATDVPARLIAARLSESFGQQVVIDNRPGAGSALGSEIVARALPDGYTLDRKSTRLNSSHVSESRMPSSA